MNKRTLETIAAEHAKTGRQKKTGLIARLAAIGIAGKHCFSSGYSREKVSIDEAATDAKKAVDAFTDVIGHMSVSDEAENDLLMQLYAAAVVSSATDNGRPRTEYDVKREADILRASLDTFNTHIRGGADDEEGAELLRLLYLARLTRVDTIARLDGAAAQTRALAGDAAVLFGFFNDRMKDGVDVPKTDRRLFSILFAARATKIDVAATSGSLTMHARVCFFEAAWLALAFEGLSAEVAAAEDAALVKTIFAILAHNVRYGSSKESIDIVAARIFDLSNYIVSMLNDGVRHVA